MSSFQDSPPNLFHPAQDGRRVLTQVEDRPDHDPFTRHRLERTKGGVLNNEAPGLAKEDRRGFGEGGQLGKCPLDLIVKAIRATRRREASGRRRIMMTAID